MHSEDRKHRLRQNRNLAILILFVWASVSLGAVFFAETLNHIMVLGFPLGYFMGAQGSILSFVLLAAWYTRRMNAETRRHESEESK